MNETVNELKDVVVIYHAHCIDGFAAAWVTHRKFGDVASYVPLKRGEGIPVGLEGKEIYVVDYAWDGELMFDLEKIVKKLVVIDHHESSEKSVRGLKEYCFDLNHSGAYLTFQYFFPDEKIPEFIKYISEMDIYKPVSKNVEKYFAYIRGREKTFYEYYALYELLETEKGKEKAIEVANELEKYLKIILEPIIDGINFVEFEGYKIPAVNLCLPISERSEVLRLIYGMYPPVAMSYRYDEGQWKVSLRSDNNSNFDCAKLAERYGGGGHKGSAGFAVSAKDFNLPFAKIIKEE